MEICVVSVFGQFASVGSSLSLMLMDFLHNFSRSMFSGQWHRARVFTLKSNSKVQLGVVTTWMGGCYMLGFVLALRFLFSQILCMLCKSPSDETIN